MASFPKITLVLVLTYSISLTLAAGEDSDHLMTPDQVTSSLEQASAHFKKNLGTIALITPSACVSGYRPGVFRSSMITYDGTSGLLGNSTNATWPLSEMTVSLMEMKDRIALQCSEISVLPKVLSCKVLFALCLSVSHSGCKSTVSTIFTTPNGVLWSTYLIETDDCALEPEVVQTTQGITLPPPKDRCAKLIDIRPVPFAETHAVPDMSVLAVNLTLSNRSGWNKSRAIFACSYSTLYSQEDDQRNVEVTRQICVIPARALVRSGKVLVSMFTLRAWLAIVFALMGVCILVSFPSPRAAVKLMISLFVSILVSSEVTVPFSSERLANFRFAAFTIAYFMTQVVLVNIYKNEITSELSKTHDEKLGFYMPTTQLSHPDVEGHFQSLEIFKILTMSSMVKREAICDSFRSSIEKLYFMTPLRVGEKVQYSSLRRLGCNESMHQPEYIRTIQKSGLITSKPVPGRSIGEVRNYTTSTFIGVLKKIHRTLPHSFYTWEMTRIYLRQFYHALIDGEAASLLVLSQMMTLMGAYAALYALCSAVFLWEVSSFLKQMRTIGRGLPLADFERIL